jgi:hypothetical protein
MTRKPHRRQKRSKPPSPDEIEIFKRHHAATAAEITNRYRHEIYYWRRELKLSSPEQECVASINWNAIDPEIGTSPDAVVAKKFGIRKRTLSRRRQILGRPAYKIQLACAFCGSGFLSDGITATCSDHCRIEHDRRRDTHATAKRRGRRYQSKIMEEAGKLQELYDDNRNSD